MKKNNVSMKTIMAESEYVPCEERHLFNSTIVIKKFISLKDRTNLIEEFSEIVFPSTGVGFSGYRCNAEGFAIKYLLVKYFTNIDLSNKPEEINSFLASVDIIDTIVDVVGKNYYNELIADLMKYSENKKQNIRVCESIKEVLNQLQSTLQNGIKMDDGSVISISQYVDNLLNALDLVQAKAEDADIQENV